MSGDALDGQQDQAKYRNFTTMNCNAAQKT